MKKSLLIIAIAACLAATGCAGGYVDAQPADVVYEQGVAPFRDTKRLSESDKAALMGGTLQKVYKW